MTTNANKQRPYVEHALQQLEQEETVLKSAQVSVVTQLEKLKAEEQLLQQQLAAATAAASTGAAMSTNLSAQAFSLLPSSSTISSSSS